MIQNFKLLLILLGTVIFLSSLFFKPNKGSNQITSSHTKENIVYACDSNFIYSLLIIYLSSATIYMYLKNSNKYKYPREIFPYKTYKYRRCRFPRPHELINKSVKITSNIVHMFVLNMFMC